MEAGGDEHLQVCHLQLMSRVLDHDASRPNRSTVLIKLASDCLSSKPGQRS
jgi:hypothetical protein